MNNQFWMIENHSFLLDNKGGYKCKYCNLWTIDYFQHQNTQLPNNRIFPKCLSENEKIIKDIIE